MSKRNHIRAVEEGGDAGQASSNPAESTENHALDTLDDVPDLAEDLFEESEAKRGWNWIFPAFFMTAAAAWSGFFVWVRSNGLTTLPTTAQWLEWIGEWAIPMVLIVALWLLWMRSSTREASRFGDAAALLSAEARSLEERLRIVNRELSLAREFLGTQSRELEFLGRSASEKISEHADRLQGLIRDNGVQIESIAAVSHNALENMSSLRDNLPVIANSARDVSNQIGAAGQTAQEQIETLVEGFERLNAFGSASEDQVSSLKDRIESMLAEFDQQLDNIDRLASERFEALRSNSEDFRSELGSREVDALAAMRQRVVTLKSEVETVTETLSRQEADALQSLERRLDRLRDQAAETASQVAQTENLALESWDQRVASLRTRLEEAVEEIARLDERSVDGSRRMLRALLEEADAIDARLADRTANFDSEADARREQIREIEDQALQDLSAQIRKLDTEIAAQRDAQETHLGKLSSQADSISVKVSELGEEIEKAASQGEEAGDRLVANVDVVRQKIAESREGLSGTDDAISALTQDCVRLLELIQASAKHAREDLPQAVEGFEEQLGNAEARSSALSSAMGETAQTSAQIAELADSVLERCKEANTALGAFDESLLSTATRQDETLTGLSARLAEIDAQNAEVATKAREELAEAIGELETRARQAVGAIAEDHAETIAKLARHVGEASTKAVDEALERRMTEAIASLDNASDRATVASREAALSLRDQLAKVNELAANLENRVERAHQKAQENVDNDFSRRVALITEALKSNAIDIEKALSHDVSDTAWTSYLRGDRGIFSRRAVKLLDTVEAREIAEVYDADPDFREHVSRYIHDFEAMLRTLLSTRDGHALGVTVLSSDIGKLYVALAQAIERLRE